MDMGLGQTGWTPVRKNERWLRSLKVLSSRRWRRSDCTVLDHPRNVPPPLHSDLGNLRYHLLLGPQLHLILLNRFLKYPSIHIIATTLALLPILPLFTPKFRKRAPTCRTYAESEGSWKQSPHELPQPCFPSEIQLLYAARDWAGPWMAIHSSHTDETPLSYGFGAEWLLYVFGTTEDWENKVY
jgi:hypothetical protein